MTAVLALVQLIVCAAIANRTARAWSARAGAGTAGRCLAWFVVFFSVFLGVLLALGLASTLTGAPFLRRDLAVAGTILLAFAAWRMTPGKLGSPAAGIPASGAPVRVFRSATRGSRLLAIAVAGTFLVAGVVLCSGFPRGYEPRSYHLPIAVQFFRTQSLQLWDREYMEALPANASLYYGALLGLLPERLVSASDLAFLAPLLLAVYCLGRWTGADPSASIVAACGLASVPLVAFSTLETGADVAGIAFLGAASYFALAGDVARPSDVGLAGLAAGLAFGFKSVHLVAIAFLAATIFARRWKAGAPPRRSGEAALAAGAFLAIVLALASPWLVRNQREFRNPLYPVYVGGLSRALGWPSAPDVDYLNRRSFQFEWVRTPAEWLVYPWVEWHVHDENFKHSSGVGPFFAGIVVPALLVGLVQTVRARRRENDRLVWLLSGCAAVVGAWWILGDHQPRYAMGGLIFAVPTAAWMLAMAPGLLRRALLGISAVTIVFMLGVLLSREAVNFGALLVKRRVWTRHEDYRYPIAVDELPAAATIVNLVSRPENFGLFGARHSNRVVNARYAFRAVGAGPTGVDEPLSLHLSAAVLRGLGAEYVYVSAATALRLDPDVRLVEVGRTAGHGVPARVLFRLEAPGIALPAAENRRKGFRKTSNRLP